MHTHTHTLTHQPPLPPPTHIHTEPSNKEHVIKHKIRAYYRVDKNIYNFKYNHTKMEYNNNDDD